MNQILSDETKLDQFEAYNSGKMDLSLRTQFAEKLKSDPELDQAYQIFLVSREVIEQKISKDLKAQLNDWNKEATSHEKQETVVVALPKPVVVKKLNWMPRVAAAAAVLFLLTLSFVKYTQVQKFPDRAIESNLGLKDMAVRGDNNLSEVDKIIQSFNNQSKTADQTIASLKLINTDEPDYGYFKAQNYLGKIYLQEGNCESMAIAFNNSAQWTSYKYDGDISLALCALKNHSTPEEVSKLLKSMVDNPAHYYHKAAMEIDKQIKSIWWTLFN